MRRGMTNGWGTVAARAFSAASGAVLVVVLAGCSLGDSVREDPSGVVSHSASVESPSTKASNNPSHDDPPAFHFTSGDLVLGDFTYEDVAGNVFNPCEEISAEEFAAIGFETDGKLRRVETKDLNGCAIKPVKGDSKYYAVSGGSGNFKKTTEQRRVIETDVSGTTPGIYTYVDGDRDDGICGAAVDTKRGQFGVTVGRIATELPNENFCEPAVEVLDSLYQLNQ